MTTLPKTTFAWLRSIAEGLGKTESHAGARERERALTEGDVLEFSEAVARQMGLVVPNPLATDEQIEAAYANAGAVVKTMRASHDTQAAVNAAVAQELLAGLDATQRAELRGVQAEATDAEARLADAEKRLDRHRHHAPASGAEIERWAADQGALETTVLLLRKQATLARELADRKQFSASATLRTAIRHAIADLDQEKRAVDARCVQLREQARAEERDHNARHTALGVLLAQVERGELAGLDA